MNDFIKSCGRKRRYPQQQSVKHIEMLEGMFGTALSQYYCHYCQGWHIAKRDNHNRWLRNNGITPTDDRIKELEAQLEEARLQVKAYKKYADHIKNRVKDKAHKEMTQEQRYKEMRDTIAQLKGEVKRLRKQKSDLAGELYRTKNILQ